ARVGEDDFLDVFGHALSVRKAAVGPPKSRGTIGLTVCGARASRKCPWPVEWLQPASRAHHITLREIIQIARAYDSRRPAKLPSSWTCWAAVTPLSANRAINAAALSQHGYGLPSLLAYRC